MAGLIVGGTFDDKGGKASHFVDQLSSYLNARAVNGGHLNLLHQLDMTEVSWLLWMPNIDNSVPKILPHLLTRYPHIKLIQSKRAIERIYSNEDIKNRLDQSGAELAIIIRKNEQAIYSFTVLDKSGNALYTGESLEHAARILLAGINALFVNTLGDFDSAARGGK